MSEEAALNAASGGRPQKAAKLCGMVRKHPFASSPLLATPSAAKPAAAGKADVKKRPLSQMVTPKPSPAKDDMMSASHLPPSMPMIERPENSLSASLSTKGSFAHQVRPPTSKLSSVAWLSSKEKWEGLSQSPPLWGGGKAELDGHIALRRWRQKHPGPRRMAQRALYLSVRDALETMKHTNLSQRDLRVLADESVDRLLSLAK